jgi:hypothetical protein
MPVDTTYGTFETGQTVATPETFLLDRGNHGGNSRKVIICLCTVFVLLVILIISCIFYFFTTLTCFGLFNPPFGAPKNWSDFKNQSFAVGFDLTAGYG